MMKLLNSKLVRGAIAITNMEWFCGEFQSQGFHEKPGPKYIGCLDITGESVDRLKPVFMIQKGQPPETFDFHKDAHKSFEQIAMAQITVMEWDKLKNGDRIRVDDAMEEKIREWNGRIWMGGSVSRIVPVSETEDIKEFRIEREENLNRDLGRGLIYHIKNEEY